MKKTRIVLNEGCSCVKKMAVTVGKSELAKLAEYLHCQSVPR